MRARGTRCRTDSRHAGSGTACRRPGRGHRTRTSPGRWMMCHRRAFVMWNQQLRSADGRGLPDPAEHEHPPVTADAAKLAGRRHQPRAPAAGQRVHQEDGAAVRADGLQQRRLAERDGDVARAVDGRPLGEGRHAELRPVGVGDARRCKEGDCGECGECGCTADHTRSTAGRPLRVPAAVPNPATTRHEPVTEASRRASALALCPAPSPAPCPARPGRPDAGRRRACYAAVRARSSSAWRCTLAIASTTCSTPSRPARNTFSLR